MAGKGSAAFWLSYPHPAASKIKLRISINQLDSADDGNVDAQNAICARYKREADLPREVRVAWTILRQHIKPAPRVPGSTPHKRSGEKKPIKDWYPHIGEGGCGCRCYQCDIRMVHCCNRETGCKALRP
jgi:hypothetical protein